MADKNTEKPVKKAQSVDLSTLDTVTASEEGEWMDVLHPVTDVPIGARIKLAGCDSERYLKFQRKAQDVRLKKARKRGALGNITAEALEKEGLEQLVGCTITWEGFVDKGEEYAFSPKAAEELYTKHPWLSQQAREFIEDRSNFLRV